MFSLRSVLSFALLVVVAAWTAGAPAVAAAPPGSADRIRLAIDDPALRNLVAEVLARNPELAVLRARAAAAVQRAPQVRALPEPTATITAFLAAPETRTGPQRVSAGFGQALPWFGKLALAERAAMSEAEALEARIEARRIELVTQTRSLFLELLFLDRRRLIGEELRDHLSQHEEIARSRYSTGAGHGQGVIKLQAEITVAENDLLEVRRRRIGLESQLNVLRNRSALEPVVAERSLTISEVELDLEQLVESALRLRPELVSAGARVNGAATRVQLAEKSRRPDFKVGLTYTLVEPREDTAGRLQPPEGNGDDIWGIQGGITLPIRRRSLDATLEEALARQSAAEGDRLALASAIEVGVGDLAQRVELNWRRLRLLEDLLIVQAEEAEESALAGYIAGTLNALELLDAEHVRFEAHIAFARAEADYLIQIAELEGAIAAPLSSMASLTVEHLNND